MSVEDFLVGLALGLFPPPTDDPRERRWRRSVSIFTGATSIAFGIVFLGFTGLVPFIHVNVAKASDLQTQNTTMAELKSGLGGLQRDSLQRKLEDASVKVCRLTIALQGKNPDPMLRGYLASELQEQEELQAQYIGVGGTVSSRPCEVILLTNAP